MYYPGTFFNRLCIGLMAFCSLLSCSKSSVDQITILKVEEEFIRWEGFDDPVGVRLKVKFRDPGQRSLLLSPPQLVMGKVRSTEKAQPYYQYAYIPGNGSSAHRYAVFQATTNFLALRML